MAFTDVYEINSELFSQIIDSMLDRLPANIDTRESSVAYALLAPVAAELERFYIEAADEDRQSFLVDADGNATAVGDRIDRRVREFGIVRKDGSLATTTLTLTAETPTFVPAYSQFSTSDSEPIVFETQIDVTATPTGAPVLAQATESGVNTNVAAGEVNTVLGELANVLTVTNAANAIGGTDEESDEDLIDRFLSYMQRQATSGNAAHYERWATEVSGIREARVTPVWNGAGTVKVVLISETGGSPTPSKVTEVRDYIEAQRPIGATVTVIGIQERAIAVSATVVLQPNVSLTAVRESFNAAFLDYLAEVPSGGVITLTRVGGILINIDGVADYSNLRINGGTTSVTLTGDELAIAGAVTINV